jgi:hypothetical protein
MIAVTSCVSASARPYHHIARPSLSTPSVILCNDRGCGSTPASGPVSRAVVTRRMAGRDMSRRESTRAYTRTYERHTYERHYARRHELEASPQEAQSEQPSWSHRASEPVRHHTGGGGVVTIQTAANPITVSSSIAGPMRDLIADLVSHGYRGHITCQASGHMPHSLHHTGEACDFAQLSRNRVASGAGIMYHASSLIAAHGLRDGCSFHDCGHVDSGRNSGRSYFSARAQYIPGGMAHIRHYARRYYGHHRFYHTASRRYWR